MTGSHEDVLREVLDGEASHVRPSGSFADVERRRRRLDRRATAVKVAAAAAVVGIAGLLVPLLAGSGDDDGQRVDVVDSPPAGRAAVGIWPFATAEQADAVAEGSLPPIGGNRDPAVVADEFLRYVAGFAIDGYELGEASEGDDGTVTVEAVTPPAGRRTTLTLQLIGEVGQWTVVQATADGLELDEPVASATVTSPVAVAGRATAFEGTVALTVVTAAHLPEGRPVERLGDAVATGESGERRPFAADVPFRLDGSGVGAVVAVTHSAEDGSAEQVAAVPIRWQQGDGDAPALPAGEPLAADEVVAVLTLPVDDDPDLQDVVVLRDGDDQVRHLHRASTAEGGVLDLALTPDRRTVLVAESTSACDSRVVALRADGEPGAVPLGPGEAVAVSPDGNRFAAAVDADCDGHHGIEVRDLAGNVTATFGDEHTATAGLPESIEEGLIARVRELVWVDDRTLAYEVQYEDGLALFVLGIDDAADGPDRRIGPSEPDRLWHAPARDGSGRLVVVASDLDDDLRPRGGRLLAVDVDGTVLEELQPVGDGVRSHVWRAGEPLWQRDGGDLLRLESGRPVVLLAELAGFAA